MDHDIYEQNFPQRKFTGIWIPVEIWEDEDLPIKAKLLWGVIHAFSSTCNYLPSLKCLAKSLRTTKPKISELYRLLKRRDKSCQS